MGLSSILAAVLVLAIVIFVHECGHFFVAKWCDVEIRTFSMGFGPTIWARTYGETEYRLAAIPLGGYVRMAGQDDDEDSGAAAQPGRGFSDKTIAQRAAIIAAGPMVNFVFAMLVFTGVAFFYGMQLPSDRSEVGSVQPESPAAVAGLEAGDLIKSINGEPVATWEDLLVPISQSEGAPLALNIEREGEGPLEVVVTPEMKEQRDILGEVVGHGYMVGIGRAFVTEEIGVFGSISAGARYTWHYSRLIFMTLGRLVQGRLAAKELGGPIMIAQEASRQAKNGLEPLLAFLALISVNLGIINILPIPVLDGGHLVFLGAEAIRGQPLSLKVREGALQVGMVFLGALMIFVVFNDIVRIANG